MAEALINGRSYSTSDAQIFINNINVADVKSITIEETQERPNNYGYGTSNPVSRGSGNREYNASIEMEFKEANKLREFSPSPSKSLLDIRDNEIIKTFEVILILDNGNIADLTRIIAKNCEFTSDGYSTSQGDSQAVMTYGFSIAGIDYL